jgi:hypothetical protein
VEGEVPLEWEEERLSWVEVPCLVENPSVWIDPLVFERDLPAELYPLPEQEGRVEIPPPFRYRAPKIALLSNLEM